MNTKYHLRTSKPFGNILKVFGLLKRKKEKILKLNVTILDQKSWGQKTHITGFVFTITDWNLLEKRDRLWKLLAPSNLEGKTLRKTSWRNKNERERERAIITERKRREGESWMVHSIKFWILWFF